MSKPNPVPNSEGTRFQKGFDPRRNLKGAPKSTRVKTALMEYRAKFVERLKTLSEQDEDLRVALEATKVALIITDGPLDTQHAKGGDEDGSDALTEEEKAALECPDAPPIPDNVVPMTAPAAPKEEP